MRKKVYILQPYLAPYRVELFNLISEELDLTIIYYSKYDQRRHWKFNKHKKFDEYSIRNPFSFIYFLFKNRPNAVVCFPNPYGFLTWIISLFINIEIIVWSEAHQLTESNISPSKKFLRNLFFKRVQKFLVPGTLAKEYLSTCFNLKEKNFYFFPNTVDENFNLSKDDIIDKFKKKGKLNILFSGNLLALKGVDLLCQSFIENSREFSEKSMLMILGAGPLKLPKSENIVEFGFLNGSDYIKKMQEAHVFILPSLSDCNPLVVVEALKAGNIILLSDAVGNYPEAVKNNGFVFKNNSKQAITDVLRKVISLTEKELLQKALESREISKNFTHVKSAQSFINSVSE